VFSQTKRPKNANEPEIIMKKLLLVLALLVLANPASAELILTGVYDGPLTGGIPKGVEVYACIDIPDLSIYGLGSANNGGGTDGEEFTFPAVSVAAGTFIYVATETDAFTAFFGFAPDYISAAMSINGDDAIELFKNGAVYDIYGDINVDGTGQPWEYMDGWAKRNNLTGPDGSTFVLANWTLSGPNAWDGCQTNSSCSSVFPLGQYECDAGTQTHDATWGVLKGLYR
jgi:hypothetical protein